MNIKTNLRAGKGGASGVGKNSKGVDSVDVVEAPEVQPAPVVVYYPPVSRCTGL